MDAPQHTDDLTTHQDCQDVPNNTKDAPQHTDDLTQLVNFVQQHFKSITERNKRLYILSYIFALYSNRLYHSFIDNLLEFYCQPTEDKEIEEKLNPDTNPTQDNHNDKATDIIIKSIKTIYWDPYNKDIKIRGIEKLCKSYVWDYLLKPHGMKGGEATQIITGLICHAIKETVKEAFDKHFKKTTNLIYEFMDELEKKRDDKWGFLKYIGETTELQRGLVRGNIDVLVNDVNRGQRGLMDIVKEMVNNPSHQNFNQQKGLEILKNEMRAVIQILSTSVIDESRLKITWDDNKVIKIGKPHSNTDCTLISLSEKQHKIISSRRILCIGDFDELSKSYIGSELIDELKWTLYDDNVYIAGNAGTGKTVTMLLLYDTLYEDHEYDPSNPIPFMVDSSKILNHEWDGKSIPLDGIEEFLDSEYTESTILLIDAVDEFTNNARIVNELIDKLNDWRFIISSRDEIGLKIENHRTNLKFHHMTNDKTLVNNICARSKPHVPAQIINFIQNNGINNPLLASLILYYGNDKNIPRDANERLLKYQLYEKLIKQMIQEKEWSHDMPDVMNILSEHAWMRHVAKNSQLRDDHVRILAKNTECDESAVLKTLNLFTDEHSNYKFAHMTIQEFFVAEWVIRHIINSELDSRFYQVVLGSHIQRFIGDKMACDAQFTTNAVTWYNRSMNECENDVARTLITYYMGRAIIVAPNDDRLKKKVGRKFIELFKNMKNDGSNPQMVPVCLALMQSGNLSVENYYFRMISSNERFAEINRTCYMFYTGDLHEFEDMEGFKDNLWANIDNMGATIARDLRSDERRHVCLYRTEMLILTQALEKGFDIDIGILKDLEGLMERFDTGYVNNQWFMKKLEEIDVDHEQYRESVNIVVENLKSSIYNRIHGSTSIFDTEKSYL